jgi:hypothetical protein
LRPEKHPDTPRRDVTAGGRAGGRQEPLPIGEGVGGVESPGIHPPRKRVNLNAGLSAPCTILSYPDIFARICHRFWDIFQDSWTFAYGADDDTNQ